MATIIDVAAAAAVSTATVTRYFSTPDKVSPATARRVEEAVAALGYRPNLLARGLRQRSTRLIGLVIQDVENLHFTAVCRGAEDCIRGHGYSAILCDTDDDPRRQAEYLQVLADQSAAGAILNPASAAGADISALSAHGIPVVSLEMDLAAAADSVHCDDAAGARLATRHLAEAGAGRIACVTGGAETPSARERLAGYRQVISELGFPVRPEFIAHTDYREAQGEAAVRRMFDFEDPPDALFAANNRLVIGALRALRALGRRVPEDVMVAGFDELPWMDLIEPPVTTIAQHSYEIGATAAEMLIERIDGYDGPARRVAIPPTLTVRASSRG